MSSWCVVRSNEDSFPLEVIGAFQTKEDAEKYCRESYFPSNTKESCSPYSFDAVPWTPRAAVGAYFYKGENV